MSQFGSNSEQYTVSRVLLGGLFLVAGSVHFIAPAAYLRIMPPYLPWPSALIAVSGAAEMLGGLGVLLRPTRRAAAWGLVALLIAVWPANIYMAVAHLPAPGVMGESWAQWVRIPLQVPLIVWAWVYTQR